MEPGLSSSQQAGPRSSGPLRVVDSTTQSQSLNLLRRKCATPCHGDGSRCTFRAAGTVPLAPNVPQGPTWAVPDAHGVQQGPSPMRTSPMRTSPLRKGSGRGSGIQQGPSPLRTVSNRDRPHCARCATGTVLERGSGREGPSPRPAPAPTPPAVVQPSTIVYGCLASTSPLTR